MRACMHACMHVCMYVYIYIYIYLFIYIYIIHNVSFHITGCSGNTAILSSSKGSLAIRPNQYKEAMSCRWKIVVDAKKVSYFFNVFACADVCAYVVLVCYYIVWWSMR